MSPMWYYTLAGRQHGPAPVEWVLELAANGVLQPDDLLWTEGGTRAAAIEARAAIDFGALRLAPEVPKPRASSVPAPDWLRDVEKAEQTRPQTPAAEGPDWLKDVGPGTAAEGPRRPTMTAPAPDWLGDVVAAAPPAPSEAAPAVPTAIPVASLVPPTAGTAFPLAVPVQSTEPVLPAELAEPRLAGPAPAPDRLPREEVTGEVGPPLQAVGVIAVAGPVSEPILESTPVDPNAVDVELVLETVPLPPEAVGGSVGTRPENTGFDPHTGQIRDPEQYKKWHEGQKHSSGQAGLSGSVHVSEIFQQARRELERWIDEDNQREFIVTAAPEAVRRHPEIQQLLQRYGSSGTEMRQRLERHVDFLVDNRKRFYASRG